jgi:hypothetical protein
MAFLTLACSYGFSQNSVAAGHRTEQQHYYNVVKGTLGTYANPPRLVNGQVDEKRLIAELKDIHANTYNWLVFRKNADNLDALKHFLPLARKAGIKVWVTLVPPSEPPPSEPYRLDFDQWAAELAVLSKKEPNLVAWSIDDFVHNLRFFTPEYVKEFLSRAHGINPKLVFIPCCYYKYITDSFVKNYGHLFGGILFPYRAGSDGLNLKDPTLVASEIARIRDKFGSKIQIIVDVYASPHSTLGSSTPEYVHKVIDAGIKNADGVMIYCHQNPDKKPKKYKIIKEAFSKGFAKR